MSRGILGRMDMERKTKKRRGGEIDRELRAETQKGSLERIGLQKRDASLIFLHWS